LNVRSKHLERPFKSFLIQISFVTAVFTILCNMYCKGNTFQAKKQEKGNIFFVMMQYEIK